MRENNRKPIEKCRKKLPQFTTMNVIDGQAGLVIYSSLIFYSLTIDNILNIIILLILAAVTIVALSGDNGILRNAGKAKEQTEKAQVIEQAQIDILGKQADNSSGELERNDIKEILDKYFKEVPDDFTSDTVLDTKEEYGNYKIPVSEIYDGEIKEPTLKAGDMSEEQRKELIGKYVTNYEPESNDAIETTAPGKWMIFNIDDKNIYLIASDYITEVPYGKSGTNKPIGSGGSPRGVRFTNILNDYPGGSAEITDSKIQALNDSYFSQNFTSAGNNMKAVAYMLDTTAWSGFKEEGVAEYAIGGPTIELLFEAYNKAHPDEEYPNGKYKARAESNLGYEISTDGGKNWGTSTGSNYLDSNDRTFVINSINNASAMWLASPSNYDMYNNVLYIWNYGKVEGVYSNANGLRPVVCLESKIELKKTETNTYEIIK